ncbi:MAG TPA: thioredoxin domain-containing protein [Vicinamibacterales bacterium]|nr:thioredoxin domain-containing protein [Vicinamibacterales bacterium]
MPNRLARERSPYLLQHANNPVDWYPWGDEAFAKAREEQKPIFLSIGYSTCHWCHVMEHESFEDASIADVLNRHFVPVKVDREERPDVDRVHMTFVQSTTGAGGWPMSVWLTPDLRPFFGGTYFPPSTRWGRPGFIDVLSEIARAWREERPKVLQSAETILSRLRDATGGGGTGPTSAPVAGIEAVDAGVRAFAQAFDSRLGGFGGAPKFPRPCEILFLLNAFALRGDEHAKVMALDTLRAMAMGGMRDHVGGGFHRYSVDAQWRVPHFEKMLYDQAQLVVAYLEATQASGDPFYAAVAEDTLDYVLRDLTSPEGGFYSAEDADSPEFVQSPDHQITQSPNPHASREGAFYVFTGAEIDELLGDDAPVVRRRFGVEDGGNALSDPQGEFRGFNLFYIAQSIEDVSVRTGRDVESVMRVLRRARKVLFDARAARPRPHLDDKILAAWNGLMIAAMARAARQMVDSPRRSEWRAAAIRAAEFARAHLWNAGERRLIRRYRDGEAAVDAFCEDYACLAWGLIELFQATGDPAWLDWAVELTEVQTALFFDASDGGWFGTTGNDPTVLLRLKEDYDGAEPSAASVTTGNLIRLAQLTGDASLMARAQRTLERYGPGLAEVVRVMPLMAGNLALWHARRTEIVTVGMAGATDTLAIERAIAGRYLPWSVTVPLDSATRAISIRTPWLAAMSARDGRATAYVCQDFACQAPVVDAGALEKQLDDASVPRRIIV